MEPATSTLRRFRRPAALLPVQLTPRHLRRPRPLHRLRTLAATQARPSCDTALAAPAPPTWRGLSCGLCAGSQKGCTSVETTCQKGSFLQTISDTTPDDCCAQCAKVSRCNCFLYCPNPAGCNGIRFKQCRLKEGLKGSDGSLIAQGWTEWVNATSYSAIQ